MATNQILKQRLKELDIDNQKSVDSLVAAMKAQAYDMPTELIKIMQDPRESETMMIKARYVFQSIGNLGLSPVLDATPPENPDYMMFNLQCAVNQHKQNLAQIVGNLNALIADKRMLTTPQVPMNTEESPPEKRVCDEAYVLMRGLCALESAEDAMVNARLFINSMDEKERDKEIERFKVGKEWISLQEQTDDVTVTQE